MRRCLLRRTLTYSRSYSNKKPPDRYNFNPQPSFSDVPEEKELQYPTVTARDLASYSEPPRQVKMLARDFIEDSLYNPNYGYFSKEAVIFSTSKSDEGFDFPSIRNSSQFRKLLAARYQEYADQKILAGPGAQVWHTPTELFQPWYGEAIARCLVSEYLLKYFPYEDFIIYETGAGNGTLAQNILDFLASEHPEVYERTQYRIIEISSALASLQRKRLSSKHPCVEIINESIFEWKRPEYAPCFVLALEVIDNFAHDAVRYDLNHLGAYETLVTISDANEFSTLFQPVADPLISGYLNLRRATDMPSPLPRYFKSQTLRAMYRALPFAPNLSKPEYIPTRLLSFLRVLRAYFPRHKLLLSDFSSLPESIEGYNSPVVQTRLQGHMVPVSTFMVKQGYFDIFFPTDFDLLREMYEFLMSRPPVPTDADHLEEMTPSRSSPLMTSSSSMELGARYFFSKGRRIPIDGVMSGSGLPIGTRKSNVFTHKEFLQSYGQLDKTLLRNGENPMLDYYQNVKFLF